MKSATPLRTAAYAWPTGTPPKWSTGSARECWSPSSTRMERTPRWRNGREVRRSQFAVRRSQSSPGTRAADLVRDRRAAGGKRAEDSADAAETNGRAIGNQPMPLHGLIDHGRAILADVLFDFGLVATDVDHRVT